MVLWALGAQAGPVVRMVSWLVGHSDRLIDSQRGSRVSSAHQFWEEPAHPFELLGRPICESFMPHDNHPVSRAGPDLSQGNSHARLSSASRLDECRAPTCQPRRVLTRVYIVLERKQSDLIWALRSTPLQLRRNRVTNCSST